MTRWCGIRWAALRRTLRCAGIADSNGVADLGGYSVIVDQINADDYLIPGLREIALKIVSRPGFLSDDGLTDAFEAWRKALTPEQWRRTVKALTCRFLLDVRAEYDKGLPVPRPRTPEPQPRMGGIRIVEAVVEPEPEPADDPVGEADDAPDAVLRHSSESEDWSAPSAPEKAPEPERNPAHPKRKTPPPTPKFGPVVVSHVSDRAPEPEPQPEPVPAQPEPEAPATKPVPVQQDSWKTETAQNVKAIPSLAARYTINGVVKTEGQATLDDIPALNYQDEQQIQAYFRKNTHLRAQVDRRDELSQRDRVAMRVNDKLVQELQAAVDRRNAAGARLVHSPKGTAIEQLSMDVLIECGYERRAA